MSFIVFEGADQCGKTSMVAMTATKMKQLGQPVCELSFPRYDQPSGDIISKLLHRRLRLLGFNDDGRLRSDTELTARELSDPDFKGDVSIAPEQATVFEAMQLLDKWSAVGLIEGNRSDRIVTVSSRWKTSALLYALDAGFEEAWLRSFLDFLPDADLNILLDIDEDAALARKPAGTRDTYEQDRDKQKRLRAAYRRYWRSQEPLPGTLVDRWVIVNATGPREKVFAAVWDVIVTHLLTTRRQGDRADLEGRLLAKRCASMVGRLEPKAGGERT